MVGATEMKRSMTGHIKASEVDETGGLGVVGAADEALGTGQKADPVEGSRAAVSATAG